MKYLWLALYNVLVVYDLMLSVALFLNIENGDFFLNILSAFMNIYIMTFPFQN